MFKRVQIKGGYGFVNGEAANIKIISTASPVRVVGLSVNDKPIFESIMRAPWGMPFEQTVKRVEFHSDTDQTIEVWLGKMQLDYVQVSTVGSTKILSKAVLAYPGVSNIAPQKLRKSIKIKADKDVLIGKDGGGWPLAAGEKEEFETVDEISVYIEKPPFDVSLIGADTDVATALAIASTNSFTRFKGETYAIDQSGSTKKITDAGAITNLNGNIGTEKAALIKAFNGALYVVGQIVGGIALFKSTDGNTFSKLKEVAGSIGPVLYSTNFYRGIISGSAYNEVYLVADLVNETLAARPLRVNNTSRRYMSNGEFDYEVGNQGIYRRAANNPQGAFDLLVAGDWRAGSISGITGLPVAVSSASKVTQINNDGTTLVLSTSNAQYSEPLTGYFNIGVDAWYTPTKLLFFVDGTELSVPIARPQAFYGGPQIDGDTNELYGLTSSATNNTLFKVPFNQQLAVNPVKINTLEFLN